MEVVRKLRARRLACLGGGGGAVSTPRNQLGCWSTGLTCGTPSEGPQKPRNAAVEGPSLPASTWIALRALGNFYISDRIPFMREEKDKGMA